MEQRTILYHKDYGPDGVEFDMARESADTLAEEGWVDCPSKIGVNLFGRGEAVDAAMKQRQADFERDPDAQRIGGPGPTTSNEEVVRAVRQREEALARLRTQEDENKRLKRLLKESQEKLRDHQSDARKIEERKRTGPQVQGADVKTSGDTNPDDPEPTDTGGDDTTL